MGNYLKEFSVQHGVSAGSKRKFVFGTQKFFGNLKSYFGENGKKM